jgi:hypothetical protein
LGFFSFENKPSGNPGRYRLTQKNSNFFVCQNEGSNLSGDAGWFVF